MMLNTFFFLFSMPGVHQAYLRGGAQRKWRARANQTQTFNTRLHLGTSVATIAKKATHFVENVAVVWYIATH